MKKYLLLLLLSCTLSLSAQDSEVLRWSGDTLFVNTTTLCPDIKGYNGATPVLITLVNGKVIHIEALPNRETRSYFRAVRQMLMNKWNGQKVSDAITLDVDVVSGATLSSRAIIGHVRAGLTEARETLPAEDPAPSFPLVPVFCGVGGIALFAAIFFLIKKKKQK